jgi:hypothetical protein
MTRRRAAVPIDIPAEAKHSAGISQVAEKIPAEVYPPLVGGTNNTDGK